MFKKKYVFHAIYIKICPPKLQRVLKNITTDDYKHDELKKILKVSNQSPL